MKCPDAELLERMLDGEAPDAEALVRAHLEGCAACREKARAEGALGASLRAFFERKGPPTVRETTPCPSAEELALYAEGRVQVYRRKELLRHFCACPACAHTALSVARHAATEAEAPPAELLREARSIYHKEKDRE
ncbi:MAG: hypothetical protein NT045_08845 [Candidatus Aureabacteria bacterium]|nr:hypothetical protein [Candidatus Auribacterota bacterium]